MTAVAFLSGAMLGGSLGFLLAAALVSQTPAPMLVMHLPSERRITARPHPPHRAPRARAPRRRRARTALFLSAFAGVYPVPASALAARAPRHLQMCPLTASGAPLAWAGWGER